MKKGLFNIGTKNFFQDVGLLLLLASLFFGAALVAASSPELRLEQAIMLFVTFVAMLLTGYRLTIFGVVCAGLQIIVYASYKLFSLYVRGIAIAWPSYIWLFYPLLAVGAMLIFIETSAKIELENEMLREQVDDLVIIDPLTGLYNLKALYLDLRAQIALSMRQDSVITLMIIALRYEEELKRILGRKKFDMLRQRIATLVRDSIRIEDRLYAIDEKGTLATILTCSAENADIVKRRIKSILMSEDAAPDIVRGHILRLDFKIAYAQYDKERFGRNVLSFKKQVESELQFDV